MLGGKCVVGYFVLCARLDVLTGSFAAEEFSRGCTVQLYCQRILFKIFGDVEANEALVLNTLVQS